MTLHGVSVCYAYAREGDAEYSLTTGITQNDWFELVPSADLKRKRVWFVVFKHDNDDNTNRTLELRWTLSDGTVETIHAGENCPDNTAYFLYKRIAGVDATAQNVLDAATSAVTAGSGEADNAIPLSFSSEPATGIEMRTTSAVGTALKFYVCVIMDVLEAC